MVIDKRDHYSLYPKQYLVGTKVSVRHPIAANSGIAVRSEPILYYIRWRMIEFLRLNAKSHQC